MAAKFMGRYVVADPEICHGKPTFRGTRILVADVLEQVADGLAWETIPVIPPSAIQPLVPILLVPLALQFLPTVLFVL